jgi:predicted helicase
MVTFEAFFGTFTPTERAIGEPFERATKWFLENAAEYRDEFKNVWLLDDWPEKDFRDIGIDLVAEEHGGKLWAVQSKCYNEDNYISKSGIDSFLSASSQRKFSQRLLVATTNHIGPNATKTISLQEKPVGLVLLDDLIATSLEWPTSIGELRPIVKAPKPPRPHQSEAVRSIVHGFKSEERGQLIMPCGTGKTLTTLFAAEEMGSKLTLIVVPSLLLLKQTLREWMDNATRPFHPIAVCSDETAMTRDDVWSMSTSELGIRRITTDPEELIDFLRERDTLEWKVVLSTYQSLAVVAAAQKDGGFAYDLAIADEAHRLAGSIGQSMFGLFLDAKKLDAKRRLFMTATPRITTPSIKAKASLEGLTITSMDDSELFGSPFYRMSFKNAIDSGLLSDYQIVVHIMTRGEYRNLVKGRRLVSIDGNVVDARDLAIELGLIKAMKHFALRKVVTFHTTIKKATDFSLALSGAWRLLPSRQRPLSLYCSHISGSMTHTRRDTVLKVFKNTQEPSVLTNARCLGEGVDVPALDSVAFIDPKGSQVDIVQATGRAIRLDPSNPQKVGRIIIPVFLDEHDEIEHSFATGAFDTVWKVVNAMRDQDDDLAEELDSIRRGEGPLRIVTLRKFGKLQVLFPKSLGATAIRAFRDAIEVRVVRETTDWWEHILGHLRAYGTKGIDVGHLPRNYVDPDDGCEVGKKLHAMKYLVRANT